MPINQTIMKHLADYMKTDLTALFNKTGTFFAFSNEQFNEGRKEGKRYVSMGIGMLCEKEHVKELIEGLDSIYKKSIKKDVSENSKEQIIIRELKNHECFYTGDPTDCIEKLEGYNITEKEIQKVFRDNWNQYAD